MTKRMLIDATHAEETRVVVLDGSRLEDFDVETSTKRQLKGNIYLAKVVRVEPSLQAAFVEYGGNRHGFLAFSEIHPDYYQIPVADRQRLLQMQAEEARREEEEEDLELALTQAAEAVTSGAEGTAPNAKAAGAGAEAPFAEAETWATAATPLLVAVEMFAAPKTPAVEAVAADTGPNETLPAETDSAQATERPVLEPPVLEPPVLEPETGSCEPWALAGTPHLTVRDVKPGAESADDLDEAEGYDTEGEGIEVLPPPETVGGSGDHDSGDDSRERRLPPRFLRNYKIQEVIRRRQIMLVQVVKEERGTKGAALTTYLSLAGRFGVLMPNSPRGGGISRKITSAADRRRLKEVMAELDIPEGMGLIVRTAGANRPKPEIRRDFEYLLRLWDDIREHTMKSVAPALIYEEASLIKRAIRDVYSRDIDEILVDGEDGWRAAHDFMRMLMPAHAKKVQLWRNGGQPLFARFQVEAQLDAMLLPTVQLRSGGYLVINQAEALVAIDVNSGRSTRERNIEETALRTNLEAADEIARQLRLRDLAGLIVIDFIDMEWKRHNAMVERRIKEALKNDRARIQVGHISHFGLLEMSRQRLRPSLNETSFIPCPHCGGTGHVRSTESAAIHILRGIEDEGSKRRSAEILVQVSTPVALYLLNHKRERLREIELRYAMRAIIAADDTQIAPQYRIERVRVRSPDELPPVVTPDRMPAPVQVEEEIAEEEDADSAFEEGAEDQDEEADETATEGVGDDEADRRRKRRRRRRRGSRREDAGPSEEAPAAAEEPAEEAATEPEEAAAEEAGAEEGAAEPQSADEEARGRRRGRRGGRRRGRRDEGELSPYAEPGAEQPDVPRDIPIRDRPSGAPAYSGPTPADPFGGQVFDIFDVMDQVERAAEAPRPRAAAAQRISEEIINAEPVEPETAQMTDTSPAKPGPTVSEVPEEPDSGAAEAPVQPPQPEAANIMRTGAPEPAPNRATPLIEAANEPAAPIEGAQPVPANDVDAPPPSEPAVKPIVIGTDSDVPVAKKRGWWRR